MPPRSNTMEQPIATLPAYPPWTTMTIRTGKYDKKVVAKVFGPIAVYKSDDWVVSIYKLSELAAWTNTEADALKIGELLRKKTGDALTQDTKEEIRDSFPAWVKPWLMRCREELKYVEPDYDAVWEDEDAE